MQLGGASWWKSLVDLHQKKETKKDAGVMQQNRFTWSTWEVITTHKAHVASLAQCDHQMIGPDGDGTDSLEDDLAVIGSVCHSCTLPIT